MGTFTKPQAKAKVGDMASNRYTGHRSKIVEALGRSDGRIYAILESRIHCVIPSPNWEILENNSLTVSPDAKREANTSGGIGSP